MIDRLPAAAKGLILPVQYLRGLAALMVVWHHAQGQVAAVAQRFTTGFGQSGVDLFFVISGFVMVATTRGKPVGMAEFLHRRIVRVVPLYWLLTLLMVAVALLAPGLFKTMKVSAPTLLQSLLFIPHYSQSFPSMAWPLLVPGWTLNCEMFFYLLFGLTLLLPAPWRLPALALAIVGLTGAGAALGPFEAAAAVTYTYPVLLAFLAGASIGGGWARGHARLPVVASLGFIAVGAALLVWRESGPLGPLTTIVGAGLTVTGALHARLAAWRSRWLQALGDASYSVYLTHLFTLGVLRVAWVAAFPGPVSPAGAGAFMALALVASAAVGTLSHRWLEQPLLRWLQTRRPPRAAAPPAGAKPASR